MLVLKKNIYEPSQLTHPENTSNRGLNPYDFIFHSLMTDREIFFGLKQLPESEANARLKTLFSHASLFEVFLYSMNFLEKYLKPSLIEAYGIL